MADAVMNREFLDALHLGNRRLQAKVDSLNAIVLNLNEKLNICIEKYGADCFIRRRKPIVSIPISPFMCMILFGFSPSA